MEDHRHLRDHYTRTDHTHTFIYIYTNVTNIIYLAASKAITLTSIFDGRSFSIYAAKEVFLRCSIYSKVSTEDGGNGQVNDVFKRKYFLGKYFLSKGKFDVGIVRSAGAASGQHRSRLGLRAEKVKSLKLFHLRKLSGI